MAEVWMGRRAAIAGASKVVAIKLLARDVLDDPAYRQMFLDEARLSMLLTNSNVVQVFDVGEIGDECYMVMEWVDGLNLSELRRKMTHAAERVSIVAAAHVIGEVLRALAYAHGLHHDGSKATIVHRDVSPQNVIVSVSGEVKLADFGVARLAREETSGIHVKGKLRYMAPEQLRGQSREPTVDLYAVGAILHELLSGQRFRVTRDEAELYSMVLNGTYTPLGDEVPATLVELTRRLLEPDPTRRMQTADQGLELLYGWSGYRNSSTELGRMVQKWSGVSGPRSGILSSEMVAAVDTGAITVPADTTFNRPASQPSEVAEGVGADVATVVESIDSAPSGGPDRSAETRTFVDPAATDATTVLPDERGQPSALRHVIVAVTVTLALCFGVFGVGFPLGWWGSAGRGAQQAAVAPGVTRVDEASVATETAKATVSGDTGETSTGETDETSTDETGTRGSDAGDSSTSGGDSGVDSGGDAAGQTPEDQAQVQAVKTGPSPKKVRKPVDVTFNTGEFNFVFVRVDRGKSLPLEPKKTVSIMSGRHKVYLRQAEDEPWVKAGTINLEPGRAYRVRMRKPPAKLSIEAI